MKKQMTWIELARHLGVEEAEIDTLREDPRLTLKPAKRETLSPFALKLREALHAMKGRK